MRVDSFDVLRLVLGLGLLVACTSSEHTIQRTYDACAPIAITTSGASSAESAGVDDALALWRAHGVAATVDTSGDPLSIVFEPGNDAEHGYYDDSSGTIYVNVALDTDPSERAIVIAHELGHAFGLYHVSTDLRMSVMNPGNLTTTPTVEDARQISLLWGTCQ